jgi:hypothetical protein
MIGIIKNSYLAAAISTCILCLASCSNEPQKPELSSYDRVSQGIAQTISKEGVQATFAYVRRELDADPSLADTCHGLSHEIGKSAFEKEGLEKALLYEDDLCGSGYVHGVIETYLEDVPDVDAVLPTICPPDAAKCFHGIGHGLMDRSRNDLPGSLATCEKFSKNFQRIQCAEGVFMENYESDQENHHSEYLKTEDPYFPCHGQTKIHEGVCAFYAPRYYLKLHPRAYSEAIAWCNEVPEGPRDACFKGIGDTVMKQNINDPKYAESVCMTVGEDKRHYCIRGLASYYIVHHASSKKGKEMCTLLQSENQAECVRAAKESEELYPN